MKVWTIFDGAGNPIYKSADFVYVNQVGDLCGYQKKDTHDGLLWAFHRGFWSFVYSAEDAAVLKSDVVNPRAN